MQSKGGLVLSTTRLVRRGGGAVPRVLKLQTLFAECARRLQGKQELAVMMCAINMKLFSDLGGVVGHVI